MPTTTSSPTIPTNVTSSALPPLPQALVELKPDPEIETHTPVSLGMRIALILTLVIPFAGLVAAVTLLWGVAFDWVHLAIMGGMYAATILGIGVGYHRLFTHKSFATGPVLTFVWGVLGSMALQGPIIRWVAVHRKHHQHSDRPGDPHSPHEHHDELSGLRALFRGLWHAHAGWMFKEEEGDLDRYVPDLRKDRVVAFVSKTFPLWVVLGLLLPAALGGLITMTWTGALLGFLWGGLVRIFLVHHVTWCINSVCHVWGSRTFRSHDESRDNLIFGILAFGEGWHNTHHAFPTSARHGLKWWQLDISYLVIRGMQAVGLAREVRVPSPERIAAQQSRKPTRVSPK